MKPTVPPPTLAELVELDRLILEHRLAIRSARRKLNEMSADLERRYAHLAELQKCQDGFTAKRQRLRDYFERSHSGSSPPTSTSHADSTTSKPTADARFEGKPGLRKKSQPAGKTF